MTTRERVKRLEIRLAKLHMGIGGKQYWGNKAQEIKNTERLIRKYKDQIMERDL